MNVSSVMSNSLQTPIKIYNKIKTMPPVAKAFLTLGLVFGGACIASLFSASFIISAPLAAAAIGLIVAAYFVSKNKAPAHNLKYIEEDRWNVIDNPGRAFTQAELNTAIGGKPCPFTFHEKQEQGLCGKHSINNAFGELVEGDNFINKAITDIELETGVRISPEDFAVDPATLRAILITGRKRVKTKKEQISNLPGFKTSKSQAIHAYLGNAKWFIGYNGNSSAHPMPTKGNAAYPIAANHLFAARKDENGIWWIIDSRNPHMLDIPLTLLHKDFFLIVPEREL